MYRGNDSSGPNSSDIEHQRPTVHGKSDRPATEECNDFPGGMSAVLEAPGSRSDSDPLESIVGPLPLARGANVLDEPPPLRSRGRGAYKQRMSSMDQHFSSSYDPSLDLHPDSEPEDEREDWDMALEALRDRELWKRKGAERLRAAGFGDDDVKKWENSGKEKSVDDVKWTIKGQAREWDIGKVVEQRGKRKGEVGLEAAWKRKDGGFIRGLKNAMS